MKKVIVYGMAHSGTTILKTILGHGKGVYEHKRETKSLPDEIPQGAKAVVIKWPRVMDAEDYADFYKVQIIRNPFYLFSGYLRRKGELRPDSIELWEKAAKSFLETKAENLYKIRYEEMFIDDNRHLKNLFSLIGIDWDVNTFKNEGVVNETYTLGKDIPSQKPNEVDHPEFRGWQINQPFRNMNTPGKISLPGEFMYQLQSSEWTKKLGYKAE